MRGPAVALVALLALTGCGAQGAGAGAGTATSEEPSAQATLDDTAVPTVEELPDRERLADWRPAEPTSAAPLACQARPLDALGADDLVHRRFVADIADVPTGSDPSSAIDVAVLEYADPAEADAARAAVSAEVEACSPTLEDLGEPYVVTGSHEVTAGGGTLVWQQRDVAARDVCTECDAVRFHRMGIGLVGRRLVLVSLAEVGGPLQPGGLDRAMDALATAALERAGS